MSSNYVEDCMAKIKEEISVELKFVSNYLKLADLDALSNEYSDKLVMNLYKKLRNDDFSKNSPAYTVFKRVIKTKNSTLSSKIEGHQTALEHISKLFERIEEINNSYKNQLKLLDKEKENEKYEEMKNALQDNLMSELEKNYKEIEFWNGTVDSAFDNMLKELKSHNIFIQTGIFDAVRNYKINSLVNIIINFILPFLLRTLFYVLGFILSLKLGLWQSVMEKSYLNYKLLISVLMYIIPIVLMDYLFTKYIADPLRKKYFKWMIARYIKLLEKKFYAYRLFYTYIDDVSELKALFNR